MIRWSMLSTALAACLLTTVISAHVTPVVVLRKQADVIRAVLPGAVTFSVTTATIGRTELLTIAERAHYTPTSDTVKFFSGRNRDGQVVGTVVFPQVDTQHGPIEVGVMLDPQGVVQGVMVTRGSVELKPSILAVERSGALDRLKGAGHADAATRLSTDAGLRGMTGYVADAIATAAQRGQVLYEVLRSSGASGSPS